MSDKARQHFDISAEQVRSCLQRLLASSAFASSPTLQRLLTFIVESTLADATSRLKAYTIGIGVFDRPAGFDPEKDSIVRVHAGRLRKVLDTFYQGEGQEEPVRINLRKGSYVAEFIPQASSQLAASPTGPCILVSVERLQRIGGSAEEDYLAVGLTDELVATLSSYGDNLTAVRAPSESGPYVLPESSRYRLAYRLLGNVRLHANEWRVCVKLLDAEIGCVAWSESFGGLLNGNTLFEMQQRIALKVASTVLSPHGVLYLALQRKPAVLSATQLAVYRYHEYQERFSPATHLKARQCLEQAVREEPGYADAWAALANVYLGEALFGFNQTGGLPELMEKCLTTVRQAVALEPRNVLANYILAMILYYRRDLIQFLQMAEQCLHLWPFRPDNLAVIGMHLALVGQWERGLAMVTESMQLNPFHPPWLYLVFSLHSVNLGDYPQALAAVGRFAELDFFPFQANLAMIHGHLGNQAEANAALQRMFALWPESRSKMAEILDFWFPFGDLAAVFMAGLAKAADGHG